MSTRILVGKLLTRVFLSVLVFYCIHAMSQSSQLYKDVDQLLRQGRASEAMVVLDTLSREERDLSTFQLLSARAMMQLGQSDKGEKILATLVEEDASNVEARLVLGKYNVFQQQWESARKLLKEVLQLDPGNATAMIFMAKCLVQAGDTETARALILKAASLAPEDENIQFELGMSSLTHNKLPEAKIAFDAAARINPKIDRGMLARIYMHYKQIEWAVVELEEVAKKVVAKTMTLAAGLSGLEVVSEAEMTSLLLLAESYDMVGLPAEAQDMYMYVLSLEPSNVLANTGLGLLLLGTGTRNFASLQACGLNEKSATQHLSWALQSKAAKGQSTSAIRNAQDIAEKALKWCKTENTSVHDWAELCESKRKLLMNSISSSGTTIVGLPFPSLFAGLYKKLLQKVVYAIGLALQISGICQARAVQSGRLWVVELGVLTRLCSRETLTKTVASAPSANSKDDAILRHQERDTAKIIAMKKKWRERQNIPSVSRVSLVGSKDLNYRGGANGHDVRITANELIDNYVLQGRPVIITKMQDGWGVFGDNHQEKAASKDIFTVAGLARHFGNNTVTVSISQHGRFDGPENGELWGLGRDTDVLVRPPTTFMQLIDFLSLVGTSSTPASSNVSFYLEYLALHQYLGPAFSQLIPLPEALLALTKRNVHGKSNQTRLVPLVHNLWIGGTPTVSPLHYDDYENLLAQIRGHKELILFPPSDMPNLYYVGRPKGILKYEFPATFVRDKDGLDKRGFVFGSR